MFLRIMGLLFGQVIDKVVNEDKKEQLVNEMDRIGIPFKFYDVRGENCEDGETKFTKLDGNDLRKVLNLLDVKKVLEGILSVNTQDVEMLWKGFQMLLDSISSNPGDPHFLQPEEFKRRAREWGHLYLYVNYPEDLTPYIHAFVYHVPQFMAKYSCIKPFSCRQPVEKKNMSKTRCSTGLHRRVDEDQSTQYRSWKERTGPWLPRRWISLERKENIENIMLLLKFIKKKM
ncbi:uncharacterized protein LOC116307319 [Actinia tenebrosa]|uniref:Uncharacterized protein LOC116307319 n=1 Tax=Actinia tenebrosa TaxID=6105 RepID=A0A6P8J1F6_ACTTE|nr:uncharacterized protein LOC116307319 [Actinia tenebrosa]